MAKKHGYFQFKQFKIHHDRATMKVGTDGVLLGAWANIDDAQNILDIGTGTGLIALMLAQRSGAAKVDGVEIESHNAEQAIENVNESPWKNKISIHHSAIQNFHPEKQYDLIISNPPYFQNSYQPPDKNRTTARHTVSLTFIDLINSVKRLLNIKGKFNVILPYQEGLEFIELIGTYNFHCSRKWSFRSRAEKPIERLLLEFSYNGDVTEEGEINLYVHKEQWSDAYKKLTKEFYLNI
jgi:tRNA1Val (adenine37-N6)-methyltransferase